MKLDDTVAPSTPALRLLGELGSKVLILEDSYYSRAGGLSGCKAGKERFLWVIAFGQPNRETLSIKLASCRGNLELADEGVNWKAGEGAIEIHWLSNPASKSKIYAKYLVGEDGEVKLLGERKR